MKEKRKDGGMPDPFGTASCRTGGADERKTAPPMRTAAVRILVQTPKKVVDFSKDDVTALSFQINGETVSFNEKQQETMIPISGHTIRRMDSHWMRQDKRNVLKLS